MDEMGFRFCCLPVIFQAKAETFRILGAPRSGNGSAG